MPSKMKKQAIPSLSGSQTTEQLLHDLQMHQIELEMQNEELRRTQAELEASQAHYFHLFDRAPIGFVLLNEMGLILEANLTLAARLSVAGNALVKQSLTQFILPADLDIYYHHCNQLLKTGAPQVCELRMVDVDGKLFWAQLETSGEQETEGAPVGCSTINYITELKQAELELRENERRFRELIENVELIAVMLDAEGRVTFCNDYLLRLTGRNRPDVLGQDWFALFAPADLHIGDVFRTALRQDTIPAHLENEILTSSGERRLVSWNNIILRDGQGRVIGTNSIGEDITERKRAEEALRESEEKWRSFVNASPDYIALHDSEGLYLFLNHYAEGFTEKDVLGTSLYQYLLPESVELFRGKMEKALKTWTTQHFEYTALGDLGTSKIYEGYLVPLRGKNQGINILSVSRNITDRKQAQDALRESKQLLENTLASLLDAVFIIDADTVEIIDCNPAASEIFGYSRQEMLSRTTAFLHVDEAALEEFRQYLNPAIEEKGFFFMPKFGMKRKDGTVFPTEHSVVPLENEQGKRMGWVSVVRDITERVRAENELAQSHEQLHALTAYWQATVEAERAYIAREMHDEFGQSMTALKMDLTWLAKRLPEGDERVKRIHGMNDLVDDSIALMRRIATELRPNMLDDLGLNAALEWQSREFSRHSGIPCKVNLPEHDLNFDLALKTTLFRIFQETLTNVARHAQATHIKASLQQKKQSVILTISDNGRGISESELQDPRSLGLLGLRERAVQWGGETIIRGVAGKGTTVTVRIPLPASLAIGGHR